MVLFPAILVVLFTILHFWVKKEGSESDTGWLSG
jgi:hypothetical protein